MNSLNLRVSTVKTGENTRRNSEIRTSLVPIPKKYIESEDTYCLQFKKSKTIPEQVAVVKNVFKNIGSDPAVLQFLADLYFYTPPKHPVRNQIAKLLLTASRLETGGIEETTIVQSLAATLCDVIEAARASPESSQWSIAVTSIAGCFENFACGLKALESKLQVAFPFMCSSLQRFLTELDVLSSPSVRNEYYLYVHNAVRLILSCIQEFSDYLKQHHSEQLKNLQTVGQQVIKEDDIPMDIRTNSGILMAYIAKILQTYEEFIQEVKQTKKTNEIVLCIGIVNTFDYHDFARLSKDIRDICTKIDEIANSNSTVPNILLCAARSLYQISKILLSFDFKPKKEMSEDTKLILRKLLIFSFCYLEHHMDSIRHICKDLLRNVIALSKKMSFEYLLTKIFDACNSERLSLSMKCVVLLQAVSILGSQTIIKNCKGLFTKVFAEHLGRDFLVNNLFEGLMASSHKEVEFEEWKNLWISYLLDIAGKNDSRLADVEILLVKAVKCEPQIVQYIIDNNIKDIPISTKLSALWAVRKSGIVMENFNDILMSFSSNLLVAILSNCDDTRIMALRLIVETHKTTELLSALECETILLFLEYNSNCQSPATRQKILSLLGKALIRCELNLLKVLKEQSNDGKQVYIKFIMDFASVLVNNLSPGANFSRRSISLQLLEICVRVLINCNLHLDEYLPKNTTQTLMDSISDTYEANKEWAVSILRLIEDKKGLKIFPKESLNEIKTLLISVRPSDSVTGAYRLEFFCNKANHSVFGNFDSTTTYCPVHYAALRWTLNIIKDGLRLGKESILLAAKKNPLYGALFTLRHLLKRLDFQGFSKDIAWRIFIAEIIVVCKELTNVVGPVVNSSSPEGHLPNDFSELPKHIASGTEKGAVPRRVLSTKTKQTPSQKTTPQMVLLCAWRTVKEVSLILGEIVLRSPIQYSKITENFLVTKEQILEIGEHFKLLLSETKHRGAFEQAYVGFSKLCARLWRVESHDLNVLPMTWLQELISIISKDEQINEKICSTRRSAGVPFMVQALITSELQVGTTKSLYLCMHQLMNLCGNQEKSTEARSHALNILRALFRCTDLNENIGEFASDGVMCALRGYEASTWAEKNSATLLFSALITRIFGVQRTKDSDNLNIRNRMTGRIFFLRYPKLYDFFLDELKKASELILRHERADKLHPLLIILSRLYPSALEGTESNLKLTEFIPYISHCAGCPEMQTRYLASKAIVALISVDSVQCFVLKKCAEIMVCADDLESINLNILHGNFLQIMFLIKACQSLDVDFIGDISSTIVTFHMKSKIKNAVILKVMLDIFIKILSGLEEPNLPEEIMQNMLYFTTVSDLHEPELSYYYPVFRKSLYIYNLHNLRLTLPFGDISDFLLSPSITHESVYLEEAQTCLNILILILNKNHFLTDMLLEFEVTEDELAFMEALPENILDPLQIELSGSKVLHSMLKEVIQNPKFYPECAMKAYAALSQLEKFDFKLTYLLKESKNQTGDVKSALALCVERFIIMKGIDFRALQLCLDYLIDISHPANPDCLRLKASHILWHIAVHFPTAIEKKKLKSVKSFITLILALLMDEDFEVRDNTTKIVLLMPKEDIGLETVLSSMAQRLFLQYTADHLKAIRADDDYVIGIFKAVAETQSAAANIDPNDGKASSSGSVNVNGGDLEIFDKNEANVFAEPLRAISDNIVIYKNTFSNRHKVMNVVNTFKVC